VEQEKGKNEIGTEAGLTNIQVQLKQHNESVTKFMPQISVNLVTLQAGAKHELSFSKLASDLIDNYIIFLTKNN
jgi:hypothetical protein